MIQGLGKAISAASPAMMGIGAIGGLFQAGMARRSMQRIHQDNREHMRQMQQITWDREDTAAQRKVADLRSAGLSPTLAAGQGAQTSQPIDSRQEDSSAGRMQQAAAFLQLSQMSRDVGKTFAETERIKAETEHQKKENTYQDLRINKELEEITNRTYGQGLMNRFALDTFHTRVQQEHFKTEIKDFAAQQAPWSVVREQYQAKMNNQQLETLRHNYDWYKRFGLPVSTHMGDNLGLVLKGGSIMEQLARELTGRTER